MLCSSSILGELKVHLWDDIGVKIIAYTILGAPYYHFCLIYPKTLSLSLTRTRVDHAAKRTSQNPILIIKALILSGLKIAPKVTGYLHYYWDALWWRRWNDQALRAPSPKPPLKAVATFSSFCAVEYALGRPMALTAGMGLRDPRIHSV